MKWLTATTTDDKLCGPYVVGIVNEIIAEDSNTFTIDALNGIPVSFDGRQIFYLGDHKAQNEVFGSPYSSCVMPNVHMVEKTEDWEHVWMSSEPVFEVGEILDRVRKGAYRGYWVHEPWYLDVGPFSQTHVICIAIFHACVKACLRVVYLITLCTKLRKESVWHSVIKSALRASDTIKKDIVSTGDELIKFLGKNEDNIRMVHVYHTIALQNTTSQFTAANHSTPQ